MEIFLLMEIVLCSVPSENPGAKFRRKRSEGAVGINPKIAITQLTEKLYIEKDALTSLLSENELNVEKFNSEIESLELSFKKESKTMKTHHMEIVKNLYKI